MFESISISETATTFRTIKSNIPEPQFGNDISSTPQILKFEEDISNLYEELIHWRRNLFDVPTNKAGRQFVGELAIWLEHFNTGSAYQRISLKVFMILPALLLQKPCSATTSAELTSLLRDRLALWEARDIPSLLRQAKTIQRQLSRQKSRKKGDDARRFANLMFEGKVNAAMRGRWGWSSRPE